MIDHLMPFMEEDADGDPLRQFSTWRDEAGASGVREPEAMALASASPDGRPSARMVLLKSFDERGFVFFSNYSSRKGRELETNPHAALLFHWDPLGRQVRIEGPVSHTSIEETAQYVRSRPRSSQISALASPQSTVVADRRALERRVEEVEAQFPEGDLPLPEGWGGFLLVPERFEFWQQRRDRLHDRLLYLPRDGGGWSIERLAP